MRIAKSFFRWLLTKLYRVKITGLEHYHSAGRRVLIVANHSSFLDGFLLAVFLPDELTFVVNTRIARKLRFRPFLAAVKVFALDPLRPFSAKSLIRYLQQDKRAVIFPEGRITLTGSLMKIYDGTGLVADRAAAAVLPIRIDGAQYTPFSRLRGRVRLRWFPQIKLTILPPQRIESPPEVRGRARRRRAGKRLADIMTHMMFESGDHRRSLFQALLDARRIHGGDWPVAEDIERRPLSYDRLIAGSLLAGRALLPYARAGEHVGLLLPNACATLLAFMGLQAHGRVPAMLNYSAGIAGMRSACQTARIATVISSRRFIAAARLEAAAAQLAEQVRLIYLEDLAARLGALDKLRAWLAARTVQLFQRRAGAPAPDDPAVVLFTSGSEGTPKGVVLSHANVLANREQLAAKVDFSAQDIVLNALPMFHAFGLTSGTLLPLLSGMKVFLYPSPLHYRIVPEMAYDTNATVLFGTDTFLAGYARHAHPYDFYSMRYVFAGAERLQESTRRLWAERFGLRILEGYGATETGPVLATNTAMEHKPGTVGRFLPGIEYRIEPVEGIAEGGLLHVRGPNVMLGYLLAERAGERVPPDGPFGPGWYNTGDIVTLDEEGFITLRGRLKRFAKIGGEMVSLALIERLAAELWPGARHAALALPDARKGEQLVLVSEHPGATRGALLRHALQHGLTELQVPRRIVSVQALPLLGSGKIDYAGVRRLMEERHT